MPSRPIRKTAVDRVLEGPKSWSHGCNERQYDTGDGDGDARARIPSRTGDGRRSTAIENHHEAGTGHTEQRQRYERAGRRPDHPIGGAERGVTEQPAGLDDLTSAGRTVDCDDAVSKEQRQRDDSSHDEDDNAHR